MVQWLVYALLTSAIGKGNGSVDQQKLDNSSKEDWCGYGVLNFNGCIMGS